MTPKIAVIVPAFDPGPLLAKLLGALQGQVGIDPADVEIVIVDNGSDPPLAVADERVRVIRHDTPGSYAARNAGIREANAPVLAFTDADCCPHSTWIARGLAAVERSAVPKLHSGRVALQVSDDPSAAERYEQRYAFQQAGNLSEGFGVTANLFVPRAVFDAIGPFDETLRSGGDREFGLRAGAHGVEIEFVADAVVDHPARATVGALVHKSRRTSGGLATLARADGARGVARDLIWAARPPVREIRAILHDARIGRRRDRIGVAGVLLAVRAAGVVERLRLLAGGEPVR